MEPLAQMGEASRSNYAYLYDRIMLKLAGNSVMQRSSADARPAMPSGRCGRWRMTIRSISTRRAPRWDWNRSPTIARGRSEEHTSELQSLMRISYAVFCLKKKKKNKQTQNTT